MAYALLIGGLILSNIFMIIAWYWHLKGLADKPWFMAVLISWLIALCEYSIMVPANRIGNTVFNLGQLKIIQEAITLLVFIPVAIFLFKEKPSMNYVYASMCIFGAVYFIMKDGIHQNLH